MERLSDNAIELLNELHTERLAYNSEYLPLIEAAHKLESYESAEEHGRLVMLLCKVGDIAYYINPFDEIEEGRITMIQQKADGTWKFRFSTSSSFDVKMADLGHRIFLTREEAEKALDGIKCLK